jgi:hypothetical protein
MPWLEPVTSAVRPVRSKSEDFGVIEKIGPKPRVPVGPLEVPYNLQREKRCRLRPIIFSQGHLPAISRPETPSGADQAKPTLKAQR